MDWTVVWTAVGAIAACLAVLGPTAVWMGGRLRTALTHSIQEENRRLREELESRYRLPTFSLDAVKLTEIAAERRIELLEREHQKAVEAKDRELAQERAAQIAQASQLVKQLEAASAEQNRLQHSVNNVLLRQQANDPPHASSIFTGLIIVLRIDNKYAAVQAIEQSSQERGAFVRYVWWYNPDGASRFTTATTLQGYGIAGERPPHRPPILKVGPIDLPWSVGGEGQGWIYFAKDSVRPHGAEVATTQEIDISRIDASRLTFRAPPPKSTGR